MDQLRVSTYELWMPMDLRKISNYVFYGVDLGIRFERVSMFHTLY